MIVDSTIKQVAIVLQGIERTRQKLYIDCAYCFFNAQNNAQETHKGWLEQWNNGGYMKIVLKCPDKLKYDTLFNKVVEKHLPFASTDTIFAIGPVPSLVINPLTESMKLL